MNWISVTWPMVAAVCLTLGMIELRLGLAQQSQRAARLAFSVSAIVIAATAGLELALMRADSIPEAGKLLFWLAVAVSVVLSSLVAFVWLYFGAGSKWLALAGPVLAAISVVVEFFPEPGRAYALTITGLRTVETIGGATFVMLDRELSLRNAFGYLSALMLLVFVADASARLWRLGARRRAWVIGGSISFFVVVGGIHTAMVSAGAIHTPYMISWAYLAILVAMTSELNADVLAAAKVGDQLRESERRMDLASRASNLGMWTWDIVNDKVWATSQARALFGLPETARLSPESLTDRLHVEDREIRRRALSRALAGENEYDVEYRTVMADGRVRWLSSRGQVERNAVGKPILVRGVILDITVRRESETQLHDLHSQLVHASRVSMMGQFASALAHELSQPLGAILRNTEAAELFLERDPPDIDELRAIILDIRKDEQRAGNVIERLRTLLKHRSFDARLLSVSDLLADVAALTRIDSAARKAQLEIAQAPGQLAVLGDPVHLQQVLLNLVLNATDAVESLPADRRSVTVQATCKSADEVEFAVIDAGPGIDPEVLGRLFEPFFTTKASGMGIGLSISRTIIQAHGGRIWAENNAGQGATFRFTLPRASEAVPA